MPCSAQPGRRAAAVGDEIRHRFTSSPVAASIATLDDGRILEVNANFERDFGWSRAELQGQTAVGIGLWIDARRRARVRRLAAAPRPHRELRDRLAAPPRRLRNISVSGVIVELDGTRYVLAYTTDITERKAAEEQIQRLAFYDPLTGLPNRRLLMDRLGHAMASCLRHHRPARYSSSTWTTSRP